MDVKRFCSRISNCCSVRSNGDISYGRYAMTSEKSIGLELAIFDRNEVKHVMVGHEVGALDILDFDLPETSLMEVSVSIYSSCDGSVTVVCHFQRGLVSCVKTLG